MHASSSVESATWRRPSTHSASPSQQRRLNDPPRQPPRGMDDLTLASRLHYAALQSRLGCGPREYPSSPCRVQSQPPLRQRLVAI